MGEKDNCDGLFIETSVVLSDNGSDSGDTSLAHLSGAPSSSSEGAERNTAISASAPWKIIIEQQAVIYGSFKKTIIMIYYAIQHFYAIIHGAHKLRLQQIFFTL